MTMRHLIEAKYGVIMCEISLEVAFFSALAISMITFTIGVVIIMIIDAKQPSKDQKRKSLTGAGPKPQM